MLWPVAEVADLVTPPAVITLVEVEQQQVEACVRTRAYRVEKVADWWSMSRWRRKESLE